MTPDEATRLSAWSRELILACDRQGVIVFADERAQARVHARVGVTLLALAAPEEGDAVAALLRQLRSGPVEDAPLRLVVDGAPAAVTVSGAPGDGERTLLVVRLGAPEDAWRRTRRLE